MKKYMFISGIVVVLLLLFLGSYIGYHVRKANEEPCPELKSTIEYQKTVYKVRDTLYTPQPYAIYLPSDTVFKNVDTLAIMSDYFTKRKYNFDFSNDSIGKFKVDMQVTENKVIEVVSDIQPMVKVITETKTEYVPKVKFIQFFGLVGTDFNFNNQQIQLGIDLKQKYLFSVSGIRNYDNLNYTVNLGIKF